MPTSFAILVWNNKSRHGSVFPHNPRICSQKTIINGKNLPYNLWVTSSWSVYARECNPQKTTNFWEKRLKHLKRHVNTQFSQTPNFFWEFEFLGPFEQCSKPLKSPFKISQKRTVNLPHMGPVYVAAIAHTATSTTLGAFFCFEKGCSSSAAMSSATWGPERPGEARCLRWFSELLV